MLVYSHGCFGRIGSMLEEGLPGYPQDEESQEDQTHHSSCAPTRLGAGICESSFARSTGPPTGRATAGAECGISLYRRFAALAHVIQQLGRLVPVDAAHSQVLEDFRVREVRTQETPGKLNIGRQDITRHKASSKARAQSRAHRRRPVSSGGARPKTFSIITSGGPDGKSSSCEDCRAASVRKTVAKAKGRSPQALRPVPR